jgi:hypothetical protein
MICLMIKQTLFNTSVTIESINIFVVVEVMMMFFPQLATILNPELLALVPIFFFC